MAQKEHSDDRTPTGAGAAAATGPALVGVLAAMTTVFFNPLLKAVPVTYPANSSNRINEFRDGFAYVEGGNVARIPIDEPLLAHCHNVWTDAKVIRV